MIKRLRWKFVGVSMALITVLLAAILCMVCYAIGQQKEHRAIAALQAVDAARKMNHSYGLGLSIAQSIVQAHRGKIWCESKDGINVFYVNLPIRN